LIFPRKAAAIQLALDSTVAPGRIGKGHAHDQRLDLPHQTGAANTLLRLEGPFRRDEPSVPTHERVGSHDGRDHVEGLPPEDLRLRSETATLVIRQPKRPSLQLFFQNSVFLDKVGDDVGLVAVH
jgi:hypothetical protein